MEKRTKRVRGSNWNLAHTVALAELKREASLNKEDGGQVWERIAQTLSSRFPGQIRTSAQCRRRWDTLVKVYNHIEDYCVVTGAQGHRELDEGELASMKLDTAYHQDWYDIVEQVCSQRKRKGRCDRDLVPTKRSKSPHSVELLECLPDIDTPHSASTRKSVTHHEQSSPELTTTSVQVSLSPSFEANERGLEEEVPGLKNGYDGLMLEQSTTAYAQDSYEVSQEPQTLESPDLLPLTFPAENGVQLEEPLQDDLWDLLLAMPIETPVEIKQYEAESVELFCWDLIGSVGPDCLPKERVQNDLSDDSSVTAVGQGGGGCGGGCGDGAGGVNGYRFDCDEYVASTSGTTIGSYPCKGAGLSKGKSARRSRRLSLKIEQFEEESGEFSQDRRIRVARREQPMMYDGVPQSRRWSLKVIFLKIGQCCHACGRKERTKDVKMESKQVARLNKKARKEAMMSRKENVPAMLNAASSTSATSATKGDKPLQKDTQRISKQAALDKKEEETRSRKAERQQLGGKSSSKCLPIGKLCAKLSRKLFPAFHHGQSSHYFCCNLSIRI